MRLLSKDPSERPESAQDVLNALDAIDLSARGETVQHEERTLDSLAGGVFVGRQAEMDQLKAALEDVLGGRGRLVTLVGEPGIGKTRTSEEIATYARLRGAQVLWGRCYEGGGAPPYWPWVQAIRSYVRDIDADELRRQMGSSASVVAEIVTDVKDRLPEVQPPPQMDDPESARFRLFDSITSFLKTASQSQPLVIVLDDLHWSDQPSLTFLEFIARELGQSRVMLIGTYRDVELNRRHPLSVTLGDLARDRLYERVLLRGLTEADIARFIEIAAGIQPPAQLSATVYRHTEGNPLFVTEVVRDLVQSGELTEEKVSGRSTWSVRIPEGVREVIGRRLDRLSDRANEIFTTAAVVGREFTLDVLRVLAEDTTEGQLLDVLDEALDARIIEELPDATGGYRFAHALFQETFTGELSAARRVRLHARIAEALEELYRDEADDHATELAPHYAEAEPILGTEKLVHYSLAAGERALSSLAFEEARSHFEAAWSALAERPENAQMAQALFGLSRTMIMIPSMSARQQALDYNRRAFDIYVKLGDTASAIRAGQQGHTLGGLKGALDLHERALKLTEPDSIDQGWVLARYGVALHSEEGRFDESMAALGRAREIARRHGDLRLEARSAVHLMQRLVMEERLEDADREGRRAVELALEARDPLNYGRLFTHLIWVPEAQGDTARAQELGAIFLRAAESSRHRWMISNALFFQMRLAGMMGRWQAARDIGPQVGLHDRDRGHFAETLVTAIDYQAGAAEDAADRIAAHISSADESEAAGFGNGHLIARLGLQSHQLTGSPAVEEVLEFVTRSERSSSPFKIWRSSVMTIRAMAAVIQRDLEAAETLYGELRDRPGGMDPWTWLAAGRILGLLAATLGRPEDAESHFQDAIAFCSDAGYRPELAWTCSDYSELLLDRDDPGDRENAVELQDEAIAIAQELGMKPLLERVLAQREMLTA